MTTELHDQLRATLGTSYRLDRELGGGGMARVFVADEEALGRRVVVKVLRPELTEGLSAERFKREVRLAARLQHPHIVPLLTAGALADGLLYYTMPYVEGETLRARLERDGALPVTDVVRIARDVASALAYAHRAGVVHRDIKPENVLLADGGAVVADFGIAKAIRAAVEEGPGEGAAHRSSTLTAAGTSLGTPAYIAPEQAAGDVVDYRADLYALGVVLYELLGGRPPFEGRTAQQLLAAHAAQTPEPLVRRRPTVPEPLATLVMQLLEKQPADRPQSADEVLRALDAERSAAPAPGRRRSRLADPLVLALLGVSSGATGALAWVLATRGARTASPVAHAHLTLELPADARLTPGAYGSSLAFSPDGATIVYVGGEAPTRLWVRRLDEPTPRPLAGTEGAVNPRVSPDGRWIAFASGGVLRKIPLEGGAVVTLVRGMTTFAWGPGGTIVGSRPVVYGLWRVTSDGRLERLTSSDNTLGGIHALPVFLEDSNTVLFTAASTDGQPAIGALRVREHTIVSLGVSGSNPLYLGDGYLVVAHPDGSVTAVRIDPKRLRPLGEPVPVLDHVAMRVLGSAEMTVAPNGTLAYLPGPLEREVVAVDRRGVARPFLPKLGSYAQPRLSPDGRRLAITVGQPPYAADIWVYDLASRTFTRLTTRGANDRPEWTPDGRRIAWTSNVRADAAKVQGTDRPGTWWQPWDASEPPALVIPGYGSAKFSPRQDFVVAGTSGGTGSETRVIRFPFDPSAPAPLLTPGAGVFRQFRLSRDGRWLAYVSDETGTQEVYVLAVPGPGGRYQVSSGGGVEPVWGPGDRELFYRGGGAVIAATLTMSPAPTVTRRDTLFRYDAPTGVIEAAYDVTPDGRQFVMLSPIRSAPSPHLVFGWADEVRRKVDAAARPR